MPSVGLFVICLLASEAVAVSGLKGQLTEALSGSTPHFHGTANLDQ